MMAITVIVILVSLGILLLLLEVLVIPGVTIAGIGGLILIGSGVYMSYSSYGKTIGHYTLLGIFILMIILIIFTLKSKTWNKLKLNSVIDSKIENVKEDQVKVGEIGFSISRLAPMGKVSINDEIYEAQSTGEFINQNTKIEVVKLSQNKIIVKPINN